MKRLLGVAVAAIGFLAAATAANASPVVLTFEGLSDGATIGNFYNGGAGGNFGITFGSNSLALISGADGGTGNFSNNPSGDTIAYFLSGPGDVMDVAAGFDTGFSFYYAASQSGSVSVYSGLDGTGTLLASLSLPTTASPYSVWTPIGVSFAGIAQSAVFGGAANYIGFDDITVGSATAGGGTAVPEPVTLSLFGAGLAGAAAMRRRKKKA